MIKKNFLISLFAVLLTAGFVFPSLAQGPVGIVNGQTPTIGFTAGQCIGVGSNNLISGGNCGAPSTFVSNAVCDGVTDDTAALQAPIDAAHAAGAGIVSVKAGTCITDTLTLYSNIRFTGATQDATVLKAKGGLNHTVIKGYQFDSLTGTNSTGGIYGWSLENISIDGNNTENLTGGAGIQVYGYQFYINNVNIYNTRDIGWYSEWENGFYVPLPAAMESAVYNLKVHNGSTDGLVWNGPHDSALFDVLAYENNGRGIWIRENAGGTILTSCHSWGPPQTYAIVITPFNVQLNGCVGETANINNLLILGNSTTVTGGLYYNSGTYQPVNGAIQIGNATAPNVSLVNIDTVLFGMNTYALNFYSGAANSRIKILAYMTSGALYTGTPSATTLLELYVSGGATGDSLYQTPGNLLLRPRTGNAYLSLKDGSATGTWQLAAQTDGVFSFYDQTNALTPFKVGQASPTNSLTIAGTTGFVGIGKVGATVALDVVGTGVLSSNFRTGGYARIGSTAAPVNTTAGDLTVGRFNIGDSSLTGFRMLVNAPLTGAVSSYGAAIFNTVNSDVTTNAGVFATFISTQASAFTLPVLRHYQASQGTIGAGSTVGDQRGFEAASTLTGATSNYGFYGNIAAASGRWNLFMNGTAQNYIAGNVGIGSGKGTPSVALDVAGAGAFTSTVTSTLAGGGGLRLDAPAGNIRTLRWFTSGSTRMDLGVNNTAEAGANAGSDPYLQVFADDGVTSLGFPWVVTRSNLNVTFGNTIFIAGRSHIYYNTAVPAGGTAGSGYKFSTATNFGIFFGSGAPTLSAAQGSLYVRSDGTTTTDRLYVNTDGGTTWTAVLTAL